MHPELNDRGRGRTRWMLLAVAGLVAAVIAATVAPRWFETAHDRPDPAAERAAMRGMRGIPPVEPGKDSAAFDPMRRVISVGAVPGLRLSASTTARYWQTADLEDDDGHFMVEVLAYPRGHAGMFFVPQGKVDPSAGAPADPIGKAPAYWLPDGQWLFQYEAVRLAWQWGDGNWVFVTVASTDDQGRRPKVPVERLRELARGVAAAVHLDAVGTPVTMPFTMPRPSSGYRLTGTDLLRGTRLDGTPILRATLSFRTGADPQNPGISARDESPSLLVTAAFSTPDDKPGSVNGTVDGHPVAEHDGGAVLYEAGEGFAIEVGAGGIELARTVSILPGARDESAWTSRPLR